MNWKFTKFHIDIVRDNRLSKRDLILKSWIKFNYLAKVNLNPFFKAFLTVAVKQLHFLQFSQYLGKLLDSLKKLALLRNWTWWEPVWEQLRVYSRNLSSLVTVPVKQQKICYIWSSRKLCVIVKDHKIHEKGVFLQKEYNPVSFT